MKIKEIKAYYPKWENLAIGHWQSHFWQIVVKIETDNGLIGYGYGGGGEPSVLIINKHFKELLIGKNIDTINDIQNIWNEADVANVGWGICLCVMGYAKNALLCSARYIWRSSFIYVYF